MRFLLKLKEKFFKEQFSVGLDIGAAAIKLVKLKSSKGRVQLCDFAVQAAVPDLTAGLKKLIQSQGIQRVNLSVSGPATLTRYVLFPKMNDDELKQALKFEAQKYIPFPIDEVNLDACILKTGLPDNKILVLLAAVKKEFLEQRLKLVADAGLETNTVDIDSLALIKAFNFNYPQDSGAKAVALLNIGAATTNLNILEDGISCLSRDILIAGNQLSRQLNEAMVANLANEARASFDYYESQGAFSVGKIFLSGGGSLCPGLKDMLVNLLGVEAEYWDPLRKISISEALDALKVKTLSAQLAVAVGLSLRK